MLLAKQRSNGERKAATIPRQTHGGTEMRELGQTLHAPAAHRLTRHARARMMARRLSAAAIDAALQFGRAVYVRGARVHAIGRKEVNRYLRAGIDLSPYEGIQVVCTPGGIILTAYRNRDFRGLRRAA